MRNSRLCGQRWRLVGLERVDRQQPVAGSVEHHRLLVAVQDLRRRIEHGFDEVVLVSEGTNEDRFRSETELNWIPVKGVETRFSFGYEYVSHFNFGPDPRNNFLVGASLSFYPEIWAKR